MQHFAEKRGLPYARDPSTHGPQKCPDYICLSNDGKIHLVECKGKNKVSSKPAVAKCLATFLSSRLDGENLMKNGGAKFTEKLYFSKPYDSEELSERPRETFTVEGDSFIGRVQKIDLSKFLHAIWGKKEQGSF